MTVEALLNESLDYLLEAGRAIDEMPDIDEFSVLFESDSEEAKDAQEQTANASVKSEGFLKKSIDVLLKIISEIIKSIQNFFAHFFASSENKKAFRQFKEACLADPELRNKKITYMDYKKIHAEYDRYINEAARLERELAQGKQVDVDAFMKRANELLKGTGKAVATAVGLQSIEQIMYADETTAKAISMALRLDSKLLENIENTLGKSSANKFQKHADIAAGKRIGLLRIKILLQRRKEQDIKSVLTKVGEDISKQFSSKWGLVKTLNSIKGNKEVKELIRGNDQLTKNIRDTAVSTVKSAADARVSGAIAGAKQKVGDTAFGKFLQKREMAKDAKAASKTRAALKKSASFYGLSGK